MLKGGHGKISNCETRILRTATDRLPANGSTTEHDSVAKMALNRPIPFTNPIDPNMVECRVRGNLNQDKQAKMQYALFLLQNI